MDLEQLLLHLAGQTERAQQIFEANYKADEDNDPDYEFDFEGEDQIWLALAKDPNSAIGWECGWQMQQDEATEWILMCSGKTPLLAAQHLLERIQRPIGKEKQ